MWLPGMGVLTAVCLTYEIRCGHKSSSQVTHIACTFACLPSFPSNMSTDRSTTHCHWWLSRFFRHHHCPSPSCSSHLHWNTSPSSPSPLCSSTIQEETCLTTAKWAPQSKEGQKRRRCRRKEVSIKGRTLCVVCVCACYVLASQPSPYVWYMTRKT